MIVTNAASLLALALLPLPKVFSGPPGDCLLQKKTEVFHASSEHEDRDLSSRLVQVSDLLPLGPTKDLLRAFRICGSCKEFQRFGEQHDGGYLMCQDNMAAGDIQAAYSVGIEQHDRWSKDVHDKYGVPVYQYDCTVDSAAQDCDDCKFYKVCLKGADGQGGIEGKTSWTLKEVLSDSVGDIPNRSLLMKMDIEGAEWPTLKSSSPQTLAKFRQLVIEFHHLGEDYRHGEFLETLQRLDEAGFRVVHIHGNNAVPMYYIRDFALPSVLEVTLDASAKQMSTCLTDEVQTKLDRRNIVHDPELPLAHLPA